MVPHSHKYILGQVLRCGRFDMTLAREISALDLADTRRIQGIFGIFWRKKNETREPWEKYFYRCKRVLLVCFPPKKILKKIFRR